jgi:hypothetical protein
MAAAAIGIDQAVQKRDPYSSASRLKRLMHPRRSSRLLNVRADILGPPRRAKSGPSG